jgi:Fic family protein
MINKREYEETHPWLSFIFDASHLDHRIWLLLGEAKSKCEHILGAPLLPSTIKELNQIYLVKGALATTAIEGNTLTEEQVKQRINGELELPPSKEYLGQEIDNIIDAVNQIDEELIAKHDSDKLTINLIKEYNRRILKDLPLPEGVVAGEIRNYSVGVASYKGAPPDDLQYLLERYIHWLNDEFNFPDDQKVVYGILKAIMAHLYFVWIHPFGDGNGRTARLIEFQILLSIGIPDAAAHLLSNHYNSTRTEYYRILDKSSKSTGSVNDFINYALQGFVDGLHSQIDSIQGSQFKVHWINNIHNSFHGKHADSDERKKELILEISMSNSFEFSFNAIRHLTPRIAEMYAILTDKTLKRDMDDLVQMGFLEFNKKEYSINLNLLQIYRVNVRN